MSLSISEFERFIARHHTELRDAYQAKEIFGGCEPPRSYIRIVRNRKPRANKGTAR